MDIDKALRTLKELETGSHPRLLPHHVEAIKLAYEALYYINLSRHTVEGFVPSLLHGETPTVNTTASAAPFDEDNPTSAMRSG